MYSFVFLLIFEYVRVSVCVCVCMCLINVVCLILFFTYVFVCDPLFGERCSLVENVRRSVPFKHPLVAVGWELGSQGQPPLKRELSS